MGKKQKKKKEEERAGAPMSVGAKRWLALLCTVQAAIFFGAGVIVPFKTMTVFAIVTFALGAVHLSTAALALLNKPAMARVWRVQAFLSLAFLAYLSWVVASSASYIAGLYGSLGDGLAAALLAAWAPGGLLILPSAIWAIAQTGGLSSKASVTALLAILAVPTADSIRWYLTASAAERELDVVARLSELRPKLSPADPSAPSLFTAAPVTCKEGFGNEAVTVVATFVSKNERAPRSICHQAADLSAALGGLESELVRRGARVPVKVDVLTASKEIGALPPLAKSFVLRPGLDGVALGDKGLMPWQLVALDQFASYTPVDFIQDLRLGAHPARIRRALGSDGTAFSGLLRLATESFLVRSDRVLAMERMRTFEPITAARIGTATAAAARFVMSAQAEDGRFSYMTNPFTGAVSFDNFSVPRQAGTTLALCELGDPNDPKVNEVATRSLGMLAQLEQRREDLSALTYPAGRNAQIVGMGPTALSLSAFLACRLRTKDSTHDALIGRLGRFLLALQRDNGRFDHRYDFSAGARIEGPHTLYADGQAVLALTLLEALAKETGSDLFPPPSTLEDAVERAMSYTADTYWSFPAGEHFYIEENWHCLAARAALDIHRHDGYERFCIDYVRFKARYMFDENSDVEPSFIGAYSFSNITVPYNTPTAGYGEAVSAAIDVMRARGVDTSAEEARLKRAIDYLVHAQWSEDNCFACAKNRTIPGAFSESLSSPMIRIDYVQHAWAGMSHGLRALRL